jgi:hypothetical protein
MGLKDLKEKLYKRDTKIDQERHRMSQFNPEGEAYIEDEQEKEIKLQTGWKALFQDKRKRALMMGALISLVVVIGALLIIVGIIVKRSAFSADDVHFQIQGPDSLDSNNIAIFYFEYENNNRVDLKDVEVLVQFPESFVPEDNVNFQREGSSRGKISLGMIDAREKKSMQFQGRFFGTADEISYLNATLVYTPSNIHGRFEKDAQKGVTVLSSPLRIDVAAPIEAASGDEIEFNIEYTNQSTRAFQTARMKMEYPSGFQFISSEPQPSEGENIWYLGTIEGEQSGVIKIKGILEGSKDDERVLRSSIGYIQGGGEFVPYGEAKSKIRIAASPLSVRQSVNSHSESLNVSTGDKLIYALEYENTGDTGLRDVIVTFQLFGDIFDVARIDTGGGSFNTEKKLLVWKASDVSGLEQLVPGEQGMIRFEVPLLKRIPIEDENSQHFTAYAVATIDSPDVPDRIGSKKIVGKDRMDFRLNTDVFLDVNITEKNTQKSFHEYTPRIGEEAVYEVHWNISNLYNDAINVNATAFLPSSVEWLGVKNDETNNVFYNERTQKIEWQVGKVDHGVGVLQDSRELVFDISVTPQDNQEDKNIEILHSLELTGQDTFTNENIRVALDPIATSGVQESLPDAASTE